MAVLWLKRSGDTLVPDSTESAAIFSRLKFGKLYKCEVKEPRNAAHANLYWKICQRIGEAVGATPENISHILKIEAGHCDIIRSKKYGELRIPKSISFAQMDDLEFREFYDRACVVICENWGNEALAAVEDLLVPTEKRR